MPTVLERMQQKLAAEGRTPSPNSVVARIFKRVGVQRTPDLTRILELPVLDWERDVDPVFIEKLSASLRAPGGTETLWKRQVAGLQYMHDYGGCLGSIRVGGGKTLITYLTPTVMGSQRPLLVTRASLIEKTVREFKKLAEDWKAPPPVVVLDKTTFGDQAYLGNKFVIASYELLGREEYAEFLQLMNPDLIMADEVHRYRNLGAACTKRMRRFISEHLAAGTQVPFMGLSGTAMKRSLRDVHHLALWAMPLWCPLPVIWTELQEWADAVDEGIDDFKRLQPGALLELADQMGVPQAPQGAPPVTRARFGIQARMRSAPGMVMTTEKFTDSSLQLQRQEWYPDQETEDALHKLRTTWETPNGDLLVDALQVWKHAREIVCGFVYFWDPAAPPEWLEARRGWNAWVRETLKNNRRRLDSPLQVTNAMLRGEYPGEAEALWANWSAIKGTFTPNKVARWHSDWMLQGARQWLRREEGIVWTEHTVFGEALSQFAGVPFFSNKGFDAKGRYIEDVPGPCVVSIHSNLEGRNLQHLWHKNLITSCPPTGQTVEQLLGRTHREKQLADTVYATFVQACVEQIDGLDNAIKDAQLIQELTGQEQKLLYGDMLGMDMAA